MDSQNVVAITFGICFMFMIGSFASCTYKSGVNYNACVIKATKDNAQHCKVVR